MRYNNLTVLTIPFMTLTSWPAIHFADYKGFIDILFRPQAFVALSTRFNFVGDKNAETMVGFMQKQTKVVTLTYYMPFALAQSVTQESM